jgi:hypothetical protein
MKTRFSSPNLSKLARADISCQFMKTKSLCRHFLQSLFSVHTKKFVQISKLVAVQVWIIFLHADMMEEEISKQETS